jgi:protoporphyrinogen oxidase
LKIAVIGAGLTGLTAGLRLSQKGHRIEIFEQSDEIGGLASAFPVGRENLDRFYHHIFVNDTYLINLLDELSLLDRLEWHEPRNAVLINNTIYPFTTPLDLLKFKPVNLISRIRMGLLVLSSKLIKNYEPFENITAEEWIIKRAGCESYQKVWGPLLKSKFDSDYHKVSGTWIWNKFKLRGSSRSKNVAREKLGYLRGGFITLTGKLANEIIRAGGSVNLNSQVKTIIRNEGLWQVNTNKTGQLYDCVLFTASPGLLSDICPCLDKDYALSLMKIKYKANLCLVLELEKSLSPYYWITVSQEDLPFVLIIEHTNLAGLKGYGSHIVYLSRYIDASDKLYNSADKEITHIFTNGLEKVFPGFDSKFIKKATLHRAEYAQPVISPGYSKAIPGIKTPEQGLFLASMAQIYPEDRGLNSAVRLGFDAAETIEKSI